MSNAKPFSAAELKELLPRLHVTIALLGGDGVSQTIGRNRARKRGRQASADVQAKLLETLKGAKTGMGVAQIQTRVKADRGAIAYHLRLLRDQKKVAVKGTRKLAKWIVV